MGLDGVSANPETEESAANPETAEVSAWTPDAKTGVASAGTPSTWVWGNGQSWLGSAKETWLRWLGSGVGEQLGSRVVSSWAAEWHDV